MKVAVFGSRDFGNEEKVKKVWTTLKEKLNHITLLHGGAKGPQNVIVEMEKENPNIDVVLFKPWHMVSSKIKFTYNLFFLRNKQIIDNSDLIILFLKKKAEEEEAEVNLVKSYLNKYKGRKSVLTVRDTGESLDIGDL